MSGLTDPMMVLLGKMMITKKELLHQISLEMKRKGITQQEMADYAGIDRGTLQRNLKDKTEMGISTFLKICEKLEIKIQGFYQ